MATGFNGTPYVAASQGSKGSISGAKAEIIVMHSMECPADDRHVTNWVNALSTPSGSKYYAHFYCGVTVTYQVAPLGRVVPHVGNGNSVRGVWTLGIEQAGYASFSKADWESGGVLNESGPLVADLIADGHGANRWLEINDLRQPGIRGVTSHNNMAKVFGGSDHTDPGVNYPHDTLLGYGGHGPGPVPPAQTTKDVNMIASGKNADGRLEVFRVTAYGTVQHAWQNKPNTSIGGWVDMPGVNKVSRGLSVVSDIDGRLEAFAYTEDYSTYQAWQLAPNGGWSGWTKVG